MSAVDRACGPRSQEFKIAHSEVQVNTFVGWKGLVERDLTMVRLGRIITLMGREQIGKARATGYQSTSNLGMSPPNPLC